jgi:hypothetical protein
MRAIGQHGFDGLLIHWASTPLRLRLCVGSDKHQAGEMTAVFGPSAAQVRSVWLSGFLTRCEAAFLRGGEGRGHPAALQGFNSKRPDSARLQGHAWGGQTLQYLDARASQTQLDGDQKANRPGSHNHDITMFFHILHPNMY